MLANRKMDVSVVAASLSTRINGRPLASTGQEKPSMAKSSDGGEGDGDDDNDEGDDDIIKQGP